MARQRRKTCLYCHSHLHGRRDAKTCSDRCRKAVQRARRQFGQDPIARANYAPDLLKLNTDNAERQFRGLATEALR